MGKFKDESEAIDWEAERGAVRLVWDAAAGQLVKATELEVGQQRHGKQQERQRQREHFLRGPIPMGWLERACQLPGKAANVAISIWFVHGLKQSEPFPLKRTTLARLGVHHADVYYRALSELEAAGLIRVTRQSGRALGVTILLDGVSADQQTEEVRS